VIELKQRAQEKRARRVATRPEPTIIGNCDSWSFIVGKKANWKSPPSGIWGKLPWCNRDFIHSLCTVHTQTTLNNLWASCGSTVHCTKTSHIVNTEPVDMQISVERQPLFYRKWLMAL